MITIKLMGGLGNQMFQFALGFSLAKKNNTSLVLNLDEFSKKNNQNQVGVKRNLDLNIFNLFDDEIYFNGIVNHKSNFFNRNLNKIIPINFRTYIVEKNFQFDKRIVNLKSTNIELEGYWQSPKYFHDNQYELRNLFTLTNEIKLKTEPTLLNEILTSNSVCINVRRGDFESNKFHGFVGLEYYLKAIELINSKINVDKFYIFSDDIDWCENNFMFLTNKFIVNHSFKGYKFANYFDLMRNCKHFIIPNSSFAWWAAWLSDSSQKIVISPQKWFSDSRINTKDLIPTEWIRI